MSTKYLQTMDGGKPFFALHDDAELWLSDGQEIRGHQAPRCGIHVLDNIRYRPESQVNACFNRLVGQELAVPVRGTLMLLACTEVGGELFAVDIDTRDFTRALRRLFEKQKQSEEQKPGGRDEEAGDEQAEETSDEKMESVHVEGEVESEK